MAEDMAEGGDDESDEEEEEGNGPAKVEGKNEKKLSEEEATLVDDVEITEKGLLIEEELSKFAEDPNFVGADDTCELNVDEHLESSTVAEPESDAEEAAEATLTDLSINTIFTLEDVLKATDFAGYIPKGDDHESRCLKRIRAIVDQTRHFVALVRIKERVLNWPDVLKVKTRAKAHQAYEHAVAKARASFQCSAQRQSRFSLWQSFSKRVAKDAITEAECPVASDFAVMEPTRYLNGTTFNSSGTRLAQVLIVRPLNLFLIFLTFFNIFVLRRFG